MKAKDLNRPDVPRQPKPATLYTGAAVGAVGAVAAVVASIIGSDAAAVGASAFSDQRFGNVLFILLRLLSLLQNHLQPP